MNKICSPRGDIFVLYCSHCLQQERPNQNPLSPACISGGRGLSLIVHEKIIDVCFLLLINPKQSYFSKFPKERHVLSLIGKHTSWTNHQHLNFTTKISQYLLFQRRSSSLYFSPSLPQSPLLIVYPSQSTSSFLVQFTKLQKQRENKQTSIIEKSHDNHSNC